ncbi:Uncharacterized protein DBV15_09154 [Temnothorax longispinosus]|uniref:Uncharacterized protein n=1 Tax=Temnothorax longispinosus TaxID=300112 RepID=A0A4S2K606_9HYME|nr:Uncharacterized protein DBV15_09154 [Temnothorax longispinosus]
MEVRAMEYRPVLPAGVMPTGLHQDYHAAIPDLSPPRSQGSSTGGASSIGDYAPRMYTPPTPPTPHEDEKRETPCSSRDKATSSPHIDLSPLLLLITLSPVARERYRLGFCSRLEAKAILKPFLVNHGLYGGPEVSQLDKGLYNWVDKESGGYSPRHLPAAVS